MVNGENLYYRIRLSSLLPLRRLEILMIRCDKGRKAMVEEKKLENMHTLHHIHVAVV